jgi:serine/threonine-protein kinase RsbW
VRALNIRLPADRGAPEQARHRLRAWLAELGWPAAESDDLVLAVEEAVTNVVEHAYPTEPGDQSLPNDPEVVLRISDMAGPNDIHRAVVTVIDRGRWRPPRVLPGHRGRGLLRMRVLTDRLVVNANGTGTQVKMISRAVPIAPCHRTRAAVVSDGFRRTLKATPLD